ncbi:MAG: hypothetical protein ACXQTF_00425 [Candidatus Hecatellaceae archaeon]
MTEKQRQYMWRLAKKVMAKEGLTIAELKERIKEELGIKVTRKMSRDDASKVIAWLEAKAEPS